jgi:DNA-binding CsgD family transcriptional regulator/tetratricopeptide (TPR) repeat protein
MAGRISSPRLIGRVEELARLEAALARAAAREPAAVLIAGEAGVGKTRLAQEFTTHVAGTGAMVLAGGCVALTEADLPYAPVAQALRTLLRRPGEATVGTLLEQARGELARLLPELDTGEQVDQQPSADPALSQTSQARLFATLLWLLERLAEQAPVVLVAEDLHWADRSTLALLSFLLRNLQGERVLVVGTWRSDELPRAHPVRRWLTEQQRTPGVETIQLGPLSRAEVAQQLAAILGTGATPAVVAEVVVRSGGNPFFAEELAAASVHDTNTHLPEGLRELLLARVLDCSPVAQAVLQVAAVAGRPVSEQILASVTAMSQEELATGLRELLERQLLVVGPDQERYEFRHALVQEAAYGELLARERQQLHAGFAAALSDLRQAAPTDEPVTAAEVAVHWQHAHQPALALEWSLRAAAEAERAYAFAEAWRHYERALGLWDRVPDAQQRAGMDQVEVLARAAEAAHLIEEHRRALVLVELALGQLDAVAEPIRTGVLTERRGFFLWILGQRKASLEAWQEAARVLPVDPPSRERAELLANYGYALAAIPRAQEAKAVGEQALAVAQQVGANREMGQALTSLGLAEAALGNFDAAITSLRQACQIVTRHADVDLVARAYGLLADALIRAGRLEEAAEVALAGRDPVRQLGLQGYWHDYFLLANAAQALLELGRWDDAEELLGAVQQSRESPTASPPLLLAKLQIRRGGFSAAMMLLDTVKKRWGQTWPQNVAVAEQARRYFELVAELALWQGKLEAAGAAIRDGLTAVAGTDEQAFSGQLLWLGMRAAADRAQLARARHDPEELAGAARDAAALEARVKLMTPNPLGLDAPVAVTTKADTAMWEAERSRLEGRSDPVRWQAAAAAWLGLRRPYPAAYAHWRQAETLLGNGRREEAAEVTRDAYQTAVRLRAEPLGEALEALARRARLDLAAGQPHEPGRAGLTPRELEVLHLLVAGRNNRQIAEQLFISGKTATAHVTNILAKLGVHSRLEAAARARELGLDRPASSS